MSVCSAVFFVGEEVLPGVKSLARLLDLPPLLRGRPEKQAASPGNPAFSGISVTWFEGPVGGGAGIPVQTLQLPGGEVDLPCPPVSR